MEEELRKQLAREPTTGKVLFDSHSKTEPSGEAETLRGKNLFSMGDKVVQSKPPTSAYVQPQGYAPKTQQTKEIYQKMIYEVQKYLVDQPEEVLKDAIDSFIVTLKSEALDSDKQKQIEAVLGSISLEEYSSLLNNSKLMTDYTVLEKDTQPAEVPISVLIQTTQPEDTQEIHCEEVQDTEMPDEPTEQLELAEVDAG